MKAFYDRPNLLMLLVALFWAINFIVGKAVVGLIPPISLAALRWTLAFLIFLPFAWPHLRRDAAQIRSRWGILLFLGLIGPSCFNTITYIGLASTEAMNGLVLNSALPIFMAVAAWAIFADRITSAQVWGLTVAFAGVLIIIMKGHPETLTNLSVNKGDLLLIVAMVTWSIYTAFLRKRPKIAWQSFAAVTYGIAGFANMPLAVMELAGGQTIPVTWPVGLVILYVAIFPSLIAYIFYNRGVELLGPTRTGLYLFLVPIFGAILAAWFLGEELHPFHAIGFALILAGVAAGNRGWNALPVSKPELEPVAFRSAEPSSFPRKRM